MELKFNDARVTYTPPQTEITAIFETAVICKASIDIKDPNRKGEEEW